MKKLLSFLLFTATTLCSFSQVNSTEAKTDYLKKSKHQKTAGWILLCGGALSASLGSVRVNSNYGGTDNSNSHAFLIVGLAAIGASIPLFIASSHNKHEAAALSLENEGAPQIRGSSLVYHSIPSLTLKFKL